MAIIFFLFSCRRPGSGIHSFFAGVGFATHMFEDALVFKAAYRFLWPISSQEFDLGVLQYTPDLYGIADTEVLLIGVFVVILCAIISSKICLKQNFS